MGHIIQLILIYLHSLLQVQKCNPVDILGALRLFHIRILLRILGRRSASFVFPDAVIVQRVTNIVVWQFHFSCLDSAVKMTRSLIHFSSSLKHIDIKG